jgi:hypothetical protein
MNGESSNHNNILGGNALNSGPTEWSLKVHPGEIQAQLKLDHTEFQKLKNIFEPITQREWREVENSMEQLRK